MNKSLALVYGLIVVASGHQLHAQVSKTYAAYSATTGAVALRANGTTTLTTPVVITLGAKGNTTATPPLTSIQSQIILYNDVNQVVPFTTNNTATTTASVTEFINENTAAWQWGHTTSSTASKNLAMRLHANHELQIYAPAAGDTDLLLSPLTAGLSIIPSSLTVSGNFSVLSPSNATLNGANNTMPNQTLASASSVVTRSLGDARYLFSGAGSMVVAGDTLSATGVHAASIGGNKGIASGEGSIVLGGYNPGGTQNNTASGVAASIMGAKNAKVESLTSSVIGGQSNQILGSGSAQSVILGGQSNTITAASGGNSAIIASGNSQFVSGGVFCLLIGGINNSMTNANYNQAIVAGQNSSIGNAPNSVVVGGYLNHIVDNATNSAWITTTSAIVGGYNNEIATNGVAAVVLGGTSSSANSVGGAVVGSQTSQVSGSYSAAIASSSAVASGQYALIQGEQTRATGNHQVVLGKFNTASTSKALIIGNGTSDTSRSNAVTVDWSGNVETPGKVTAGSAQFSGRVKVQPHGGISMGEFTQDVP